MRATISSLIILLSFVLGGCAMDIQNSGFDPKGVCPNDEPCLHYSTEGVSLRSWNVQKTTAIIHKDGTDKVKRVEPLYNGQSPTLAGGIIDNGTTLLAAGIERSGTIGAAKKTAQGMIGAAEKTKPTQINVTAQGGHATGGTVGNITSTATATQSQAQSTGIGISLGAQ